MTFILPLSSQDKDPELSQVSLPDPVSFLLSYYLLMGVEGGHCPQSQELTPFLISFWNHTNLVLTPPPRTAKHSVSDCLSSACPTTVFSHVGSWILNNWAIAFPPRERWIEAGYWTLMFSLWADSLVKQHCFLSAEPLEGRSISTSQCVQGLCWRPWWLSQGYVTMWLWRR